MNEQFHTIVMCVLLSVLSIMRLVFKIHAGITREIVVPKAEEGIFFAARTILGLILMSGLFMHLVLYEQFPWIRLPLPYPFRVTGMVLSFLALVLLFVSHENLGRNFSTKLTPKEDCSLVTNGLYAYVRHPMYSVYLLFFIGLFLLTTNWLIGGAGISIIILLMAGRTGKEERLLEDRFGNAYEEYRKRTSRFLPSLNRTTKNR